MENFYARSVFFVKDGEEALAFYTEKLGFKEDWNHRHEGRAFVFQVSLFGFELILNHSWGRVLSHKGHGRVFIGIEEDQSAALVRHIRDKEIPAMRTEWGQPTLVVRDPDGNELFFWISESEWPNLADLPLIDETSA